MVPFWWSIVVGSGLIACPVGWTFLDTEQPGEDAVVLPTASLRYYEDLTGEQHDRYDINQWLERALNHRRLV
ncbi:hypothetical protein Pan54_24030 [Rubinisphaera italica]|uniref:Uncharacterized protein n=1 Tax=Rubinisphaera italica TaxID=2527969 RepID=A0A5C5XF03_9PLAN|nr:hypothetical protein Pan54_24030 [Rubinisphaera italica]